jgi:hypothetical protein
VEVRGIPADRERDVLQVAPALLHQRQELREFENFNPLPDGIGKTYLFRPSV